MVRRRRHRLLFLLAVAVSAGALVLWFPGSQLLRQRQQLASVNAQLSRLDQQNAALARRAKRLQTPAAVARIAQQQYDLVPQGEQAYQVLPKSGAGGSRALATSGNASSASSPSTTPGGGVPVSTAGAGTPRTFLGRVLQTLEFWR